MNYYPFHLGDYAAHTGHLEPMEDLAYRRLLDQYYLREGPLPADIQTTAKLIRMRSCAGDVESVLREFFVLSEDGWRHARCDEEIAKMQDKQAKARASAAASVSARRANAKRPLDELPTNAERPLPEKPANVELPTPTPTPTPVDKEPNGSSSTAKPLPDIPVCPHRKLIGMFAEALPDLPRPKVELWDGKPAEAMRARWKWLLTATRADGSRYAYNEAEALAWFERFFGYVADSDFLMGRTGSFKCTLQWLVARENFSKVVQGNYENNTAVTA